MKHLILGFATSPEQIIKKLEQLRPDRVPTTPLSIVPYDEKNI